MIYICLILLGMAFLLKELVLKWQLEDIYKRLQDLEEQNK